MQVRFVNWVHWLGRHPIALINVIGIAIIIFGFFGIVVHKATQSIDVLKDWEIAISAPQNYRVVNGVRMAVYNPGDSLVFTSKSVKLIDTKGITTRMIVCDATDKLNEREIQLDAIPATRPVGANPKRENGIVVPDVTQFAGLPRWCRLVIDVTYENVDNTGRTQTEHAETEKFIVEEEVLDPAELRQQIKELTEKISKLEAQLAVNGGEVSNASPEAAPATGGTGTSSSSSTTGTTGGTSTTNNTTNNITNNNAPVDDGFQLHDVPVVGGLFKAVGL